MNSIKIVCNKPRNFVAKDLLSAKYRMRVAQNKKKYNRLRDLSSLRKEFYVGEKI
jgi:hypothetical protein